MVPMRNFGIVEASHEAIKAIGAVRFFLPRISETDMIALMALLIKKTSRLVYLFSDIARASSPASRGGVSPPANILQGETHQHAAGEDA
jgi:hypothetical protein